MQQGKLLTPVGCFPVRLKENKRKARHAENLLQSYIRIHVYYIYYINVSINRLTRQQQQQQKKAADSQIIKKKKNEAPSTTGPSITKM